MTDTIEPMLRVRIDQQQLAGRGRWWWCVLHLIRNTFHYASRRYWEQMAKDVKPIYTAPTEARFAEFARALSRGDGHRLPARRLHPTDRVLQ